MHAIQQISSIAGRGRRSVRVGFAGFDRPRRGELFFRPGGVGWWVRKYGLVRHLVLNKYVLDEVEFQFS